MLFHSPKRTKMFDFSDPKKLLKFAAKMVTPAQIEQAQQLLTELAASFTQKQTLEEGESEAVIMSKVNNEGVLMFYVVALNEQNTVVRIISSYKLSDVVYLLLSLKPE